MTQFQKAVWWGAGVVFCSAMLVFTYLGEPGWWAPVLGAAIPIISFVVGKAWKPPEKP